MRRGPLVIGLGAVVGLAAIGVVFITTRDAGDDGGTGLTRFRPANSAEEPRLWEVLA
jgi:hypothetical protein